MDMKHDIGLGLKVLSAIILSFNTFFDVALGSEIINKSRPPLKCPATGEPVDIRASKTEQNRFVIKTTKDSHESEHPESGELLWKGDLNADGRTDLILHLGGCGNWGDCEFGVYVACETDNHFIPVLGPDYGSGFDVGKTSTNINGTQWIDLIRLERDDDREIKHILSFDGRVYDVSLIDVYEKSMQLYKRNRISKAFDTLELFFLNHDFRSYHSQAVTDAQYVQILNDYAFLIQRHYQIQAKTFCSKERKRNEISSVSQKSEFLQYRSMILGKSRNILEYVLELQPNRAVAYLNLADVLYEMDLDKNAEEFYSEYARLMKINGKEELPKRVTDTDTRNKYYNCR